MTFETHNLASWISEVFSQYSASLSNTVSCLHGLQGHRPDHRHHQISEFAFLLHAAKCYASKRSRIHEAVRSSGARRTTQRQQVTTHIRGGRACSCRAASAADLCWVAVGTETRSLHHFVFSAHPNLSKATTAGSDRRLGGRANGQTVVWLDGWSVGRPVG